MFADNALLVSLSISQWTARKLDKRATREVATAHGVQTSVGSYHKSVLPGSEELEEIKKMSGQARLFYYENTLPWASDGSRILTNKNYFYFTQEMRAIRDEWERAVAKFELQYPTLRQEAQAKLNGLFDPNDYPTDVRSKYSFDISFMPVPQVGDFRIQLADEELEKFKHTITRVEENAIKDLWQRLYDVVNHAAERLGTPDAIFRDTLVENAVELCELLPRLNYNDDPVLEDMRKQVESVLCGQAPEALRQLPSVRQKTADGLNDILSKMSAYVGQV